MKSKYELRTILERVLIPDSALNNSEKFLSDPHQAILSCFSDKRYPDIDTLAEIKEGFSIRRYLYGRDYTIIEISLPLTSYSGHGSCAKIYVVSYDELTRVYLIEKNAYWFYNTAKFIASIDVVDRLKYKDNVLHTYYDISAELMDDELAAIMETIQKRGSITCKTGNITYR